MEPILFFPVESLTLTKMDCLTITQRIRIIEAYYKNGDSVTDTHRTLRDYGLHNLPNTQAIGKIGKKFEMTGVVTNIERPVSHYFARSTEKWKCCRTPERVDSSSFSGSRTV